MRRQDLQLDPGADSQLTGGGQFALNNTRALSHRECNLAWREHRGCNLTKEWLEKVMVHPIYQNHLHRRVLQSTGRSETSKAAANDDNDFFGFGHVSRTSICAAIVRSA